MSYPTPAPQTKVPFPEQFTHATWGVFGGLAHKLLKTPIYVHDDFLCSPFVAVGDDDEIHMCFPSGAQNLPGPFFHELGHLAHWYWFPEETRAVYVHFPDRLEICAFLAVHWARVMLPSNSLDGYFENLNAGTLGLNAKQNSAIAGLISKAYSQRRIQGPMGDILTGQVDMGDLEAWV